MDIEGELIDKKFVSVDNVMLNSVSVVENFMLRILLVKSLI